MRKGRDIIGKPIVSLQGGERIATVQDLVFDHAAGQLLALLVDEGGWFRAARVVPFEAVRSFGDDAVVIGDAAEVVTADANSRVSDILHDKATLVGTTLMTTDGKNLGRLADMYFDETLGGVIGYDVTGGLFSDLSSGRSFVPAEGGLNLGQDVAFVPIETAAAMEEAAPGGLKGALSTAGENLSTAYGSVAENVKSSAANLADATRERQREFVLGKTAASDVAAPDGTVIVTKGDLIDERHADLATQHGALGSLFASAGGGVLQEGFQSARERVQGGVDDLSTATRERQREFVLGKTAGSDVTAPDGTIIVTKGDQIMPEMADLADLKGAMTALTAAAGGGALSQGVQGLRERASDLQDNLSGEARERQTQFVVGRTVDREVIAADGTLIVPAGSVVSDLDARRAETHGALGALFAAVGGAGVRSGVQETVADTHASVVRNVEFVSDRARGALDDLLGRRVQRDVYGQRGTMVAAQGQIVTPGVIERARVNAREDDLTSATSAAGVGGVTRTVIGGADQAGDRLSAGAQTVREGATNLLDRVRETYDELRSNAEEATMERRIKAAVGRPANRVILDPQDNVLLNVGEIITHRAVDEARRTGVLDLLLSSVSMETPSISPDEVRPHVTGSAALPGGHDEPGSLRSDVTRSDLGRSDVDTRLNEDGTLPRS